MVTLRPTSLAGYRWLVSSDRPERRAARAELKSWLKARHWEASEVIRLTVVDEEEGEREWIAVARPPLRSGPPGNAPAVQNVA